MDESSLFLYNSYFGDDFEDAIFSRRRLKIVSRLGEVPIQKL